MLRAVAVILNNANLIEITLKFYFPSDLSIFKFQQAVFSPALQSEASTCIFSLSDFTNIA